MWTGLLQDPLCLPHVTLFAFMSTLKLVQNVHGVWLTMPSEVNTSTLEGTQTHVGHPGATDTIIVA